jgi:hypothetical protein
VGRKTILTADVALDNGERVPGEAQSNGATGFPFGANVSSAGPTEDSATPAQPPAEADAGPDPFDPASLRLSADFDATVGVKRALLALPTRRPHKSEWVRVHPSEGYRVQTAVIEIKAERGGETYLVTRALWSELATEPTLKPQLLATAVSSQGVPFLWTANLPRSDGRKDLWTLTGLEAIKLAIQGWVRVAANMAAGAYDVFQASGQLAEPDWPAVPFKDLLRIAFKDRFIDSLDHPVLRKLRGEV